MDREIINHFMFGMMDEAQSGKLFEFDVAEKTQFVQNVNLFLRENSAFVARTLGVNAVFLSDELSREENRSLVMLQGDKLLSLLLENLHIILCLLLTAKARPYLSANFHNHHYNILVMEMLILQERQAFPEIGFLLQSLDLHPVQIGIQEKLARVAGFGVSSEEVCYWIIRHWDLCSPYTSEIISHLDERRGKAQKILAQLIKSGIQC